MNWFDFFYENLFNNNLFKKIILIYILIYVVLTFLQIAISEKKGEYFEGIIIKLKNISKVFLIIVLFYNLFIEKNFIIDIITIYIKTTDENLFYIKKIIDLTFLFFVISFIPYLRIFIAMLLGSFIFILSLYTLYISNSDKIYVPIIIESIEKNINKANYELEKNEFIENKAKKIQYNIEINNITEILDYLNHKNICLMSKEDLASLNSKFLYLKN